MQSIKLIRQSPFSAQQMFDLITDVERYDEFIPYCTAARVRKRCETEMLADLAIGYKMLRETYRSRIELEADPLTVTVHQVKGPFRHLFNQWVFEDTATGCNVHFELRFEFAVPLLRRIIEPIMNRVIERFVAAFEARALDIYG
ncbi:MAG TPA: ubiquinone-binding protein [Rhodobiaceae bacterium]|nr:ubiquinone-binding protein [Rhodobiaceae bacterium]